MRTHIVERAIIVIAPTGGRQEKTARFKSALIKFTLKAPSKPPPQGGGFSLRLFV